MQIRLLLFIIIINDIFIAQIESSANALLAVKQVCLQLFSKNT